HAAVGDVVRPAERQRLDRLGRFAGHAEVAADAVDRPGPQADARQAEVLEVDASVPFVAAFEAAVVRRRRERDVVRERTDRIGSRWAEYRGGARVDKPLDLRAELADRLEDRERADDIHLGAQDRIGPADGDLQAGQ